MGGKAPTPPDPVATAQAQGQINKEAAAQSQRMSMVDQVTPYGSLTYTPAGADWAKQRTDYAKSQYDQGLYTPGANGGQFDYATEYAAALNDPSNPGRDRYTATTTLSPAEQRNLEMTNQAQDLYGQAGLSQLQKVRDTLSQPVALQTNLDVSKYGGGTGSRDDVEAALFGRLNPSLMTQRDQLETKLRNQGIMPGTEAWTNAMRDVAQSENDARLAVVGAGGQEQSRLYDMARANQGFENTATLAQRTQPLNEAAALLNGSQVQSPQFVSTPTTQVAPADLTGLTMNAYNQNMQRYQANLGGLYGLGSGILGAAGTAFGGPAGGLLGGIAGGLLGKYGGSK